MELRKAEQEVDRLKAEWKATRLKRSCYTSNKGAVDLSDSLPSWKDLMSRVVDADIFPSMDEVIEEENIEVKLAVDSDVTEAPQSTVKDGADETTKEEEEGGYSEWGMLITGSPAEPDQKETAAEVRPIETPVTSKTSEIVEEESDDETDDQGNGSVVSANPPEILSQLESLHAGVERLRPKVDKFMTRLTERDPITKKPRYGERAIIRVKKIVRKYKALEIGLSIAFVENNNGLVHKIKYQIQQHEEQMQAQAKAIETTQQLEAARIEQERRAAEQLAEQQRRQEEEAKQKEAEELAQRAQEARLRRMEEEQRAIDAEAEADRELLALVPVKGPDGVRMQIDLMRAALKDDRKSLDTALGSLYTLFDQIVRKPEEVNFRRIRRDHPKFMEDIGRHVGGREVLIAAGFRLEKLDGVPSFFSKEPHIESDMDGWSAWFDGLKKTLEVIEEEMMK